MGNFIIIRIIHGSRSRNMFSFKASEVFGKYAGNVAIQIIDHVYGFYYRDIKKIHIFPHNKTKSCEFQKQTLDEWEYIIREKKETTVKIQVNDNDISQLLDFYNKNLVKPSHDYSFFGERCASSVYHLLKRLNKMSGGHYITTAFYPGQFRKKLLNQAAKLGYEVGVKEGSPLRKWEGT
jgi:hypothetical protein